MNAATQKIEYAHNLAGTVLKAYDDYGFHSDAFHSAPDDHARDHHSGAARALASIVRHVTGHNPAKWQREELEQFVVSLNLVLASPPKPSA